MLLSVSSLCINFRCELYPFPEKTADRAELVKEITARLKELNTVFIPIKQ